MNITQAFIQNPHKLKRICFAFRSNSCRCLDEVYNTSDTLTQACVYTHIHMHSHNQAHTLALVHSLTHSLARTHSHSHTLHKSLPSDLYILIKNVNRIFILYKPKPYISPLKTVPFPLKKLSNTNKLCV